MENLYYAVITKITEMITGLDHECLKLWDLSEYMYVENGVETWINIAIGAIAVVIVWCVACDVIGLILKLKKAK